MSTQPTSTDHLLPSIDEGGSRSASSIQIIVLHDSEISNTPGSTADLSSLYSVLNLQGLSVHIGINGDGVSWRLCPDLTIAYHVAAYNAQALGIEQIGFSTQTSWPTAQTNIAAAWIAYWSQTYGIPIVHSTTSGVCMHSDLGFTGGGHSDPGSGYPFDAVLALALKYSNQSSGGGTSVGRAISNTALVASKNAWQVTASQEVLGGVGSCGHAIIADGYSELSIDPAARDFKALGNLPCGTVLNITNPQNGTTVQAAKQDVGAGSAFLPVMGLYPGTVSALGLSGGEYQVVIERADGHTMRGLARGTPWTGTIQAPATPGGVVGAGTGGTGTLLNDTSGFTVGDTSNPDEDYWTAMNRLASERYWLLFSDGETLYLADGPDLMKQTPAMSIDRVGDSGIINHLEFTFDNTAWQYAVTHKKRRRAQRRTALAKVTSPVEGLLNVICKIDEVRAGDVMVFSNTGPGDGQWLVGDCRRSVFEVLSEITVVPALTPLSEGQLNPAGVNKNNQSTGGGLGLPGLSGGGDVSTILTMAQGAIGGPYQGGNHASAFYDTPAQMARTGTDCSGFVSWLMGPKGLNIWTAPLDTTAIPSAPNLQSGQGKAITIWNNPLPGNSGHVWIDINGSDFECAGGVGIHQMSPAEAQMYIGQGLYRPFHPNGL